MSIDQEFKINNIMFDYRKEIEDDLYYIHEYILKNPGLLSEVDFEIRQARDDIHDILLRLKYLTGAEKEHEYE